MFFRFGFFSLCNIVLYTNYQQIKKEWGKQKSRQNCNEYFEEAFKGKPALLFCFALLLFYDGYLC